MLSHIVPAAPHQVPPTKSQVIVIAITSEERDLEPEAPEPGAAPADDVGLAQLRRSRRRRGSATGSAVRKTRSAKPRKTITIASAARSETHQLQPFCCVNQTKSAGAVITATTVATRVRRRHERASSSEASPVGSVVERRGGRHRQSVRRAPRRWMFNGR